MIIQENADTLPSSLFTQEQADRFVALANISTSDLCRLLSGQTMQYGDGVEDTQ